jgi:hypothetical protein
MKLSPFALLVASFALSTFALTGCAADTATDDGTDDAEDVGTDEAELNAAAKKLIGKYEWRAADSGDLVDLQKLELKANGSYTAMVDSGLVDPGVRCFAFPCTLPESGQWSTFKSAGQTKLRLRPAGHPMRSYFASKANDQLTLKRYGLTTTLFQLYTNTCANVRCAAGTHCEMKGINGGAIPVCIQDAPLAACVRTGCSGQVCADDHRITTCEFRPEYACYQQASCERQANGQCGFTQTAALTACLANN